MSLFRHWRVGLLGIAGSALAIYLIVSQMDVRQLGTALQAGRYVYVLPCAALIILGLAARAVRWRALLNDALPLKRAFSIVNVAYLVNGVLPLRMGEVARAYLASQAQPPVPLLTSAGTIIIERLLDVLAVLAIMALALSAGPLPDGLRALALAFAPAVLFGFLVLVFLASQRAQARRMVESIAARIPALDRFHVADALDHFLQGLMPLTQPSALVRVLLWTAISWAFSLASGFVLMYVFFPEASWAATCLFTAWASFAVAVPAVPGSLGPYELSIVAALGAMGYNDTAAAAAFALLIHALNLGINALLGVLGFIQEGITLEQLSQGVRTLQEPR